MHVTSSQRERRRKRDNRERNRANECLCKYQKAILYYYGSLYSRATMLGKDHQMEGIFYIFMNVSKR